MIRGQNQTEVVNNLPEASALLLAEYTTLIDEKLKRMEVQNQIVSLTVIIFGTILSFGLQVRSASVILLYPILAFFLMASWAHNGRRVGDIAIYIRDQIETKFEANHPGWEHRSRPHKKLPAGLNFLAARGIFIGTSLLTIVLAIPLDRADVINIILFAAAIVSVTCSIIVLNYAPYWSEKVEVPSSLIGANGLKSRP